MNRARTDTATRLGRAQARWVLLAMLLVATGLYLPSLWNGFPMDDFLAKAENDGRPNAMVASLQPLGDYFGAHYWEGVFGRSRLFRPVTILSYALTYAWCGQGLEPANEAIPHHAINLLLHALVSWLVYRLLRRMQLGRGTALVGTAAFAFHALHSEVVASIVGRAELMAFGFGGLGAWLLTTRRVLDSGGLWLRGLAAASCFFLALGSKESGTVWLPITALALAAFRRARIGQPLGWRQRWIPFGIAAVLAVLPWWWLREQMLARQPDEPLVLAYVANPLAHVPAGTRVATGVVLLAYGLGKLIAPFWLYADYSAEVFAPVVRWADGHLWLSLFVLAAMIAFGLWRGAQRRLRLVAVAVVLGFAFLTSNIPLAIGTIFGERLWFASTAGFAIAAAWGAQRLGSTKSGHRRIATAMASVWLLAGALIILQRNSVWRDNETLFRSELVRQPDSIRLQLAVAQLELAAGKWDVAAIHLSAAEKIQPEEGKLWLYRMMLAGARGDPAAAIEHARRAESARYYEPLAYGHEVLTLRAAAHEQLGDSKTALATVRRALALRPDYLHAMRLYALLARDLESPNQWLPTVDLGARLDPGNPLWTALRAYGALRVGRLDTAEEIYRQLQASGFTTEATLGLADCAVARNDRREAATLIQRLEPTALEPGQRKWLERLRTKLR